MPPARTGALLGLWKGGLPPAAFYTDVAARAEGLGYSSLFLGDHIFFNVDNPETLTLLAALAARTHRIRIGTAVLLLGLREPALAAKQLATIDYLSGGRLVVGVGVGGEIPAEWNAVGVPLAGRGERTDEYLRVLRALWSGEDVEFSGRFASLSGVRGSPRPARPTGPPIWIGGRSDRALQRASAHDGWCAYALGPPAVAERVARLRALGIDETFVVSAVVFTHVDESERRARATAAQVLGEMYAQPFERYLDKFCAVGTPTQVRGRVEEFRDAGVHEVLLAPQARPEDYPDQLDRLADVLELGGGTP